MKQGGLTRHQKTGPSGPVLKGIRTSPAQDMRIQDKNFYVLLI